MSTVNSAASAASGAFSAATAGATGGKSLGKDDFLKLLTAQLSNQDPLKPMDNTEFVSQLAQFSALEQQMASNSHLTDLVSAGAAMNNGQVTSLVGKTVTAAGNTLQLSGGVPVNTAYTLDGATSGATVTIRNTAGDVVRTVEVGPQGAGSQSFVWDGSNNTGTKQPDGVYTIEVTAKGPDGKPVKASTEVTGVVTSVDFTATGAQLVIGATGQKVAPAEVTSVALTESKTQQ